MKSQDGRFELSLAIPETYISHHLPLTLRDVGTQQVLWHGSLEHFAYPDAVLISPSGPYVAIADKEAVTITVFRPDGVKHLWPLKDQLTKSEFRRIPRPTYCDPGWLEDWHFEGDVLNVKVATNFVVPFIYETPMSVLVRINARTGQLTRDAPPPGENTAKLVQDFRSASDESTRFEIARYLVERSADAGIGGDARLSRLWLDILEDPRSPPSLIELASKGLPLVGTDAELRQVALLPQGSPERNEALRRVFEERLPDAMEAYSLRVLSERWPPASLRASAMFFLGQRDQRVIMAAMALALDDPSGEVRRNALYSLPKLPVSVATVEQALSLCNDPEAEVRTEAVGSLLGMLMNVSGKEERQAIHEALSRAGADGKLKWFPEGWIILGAVADIHGDRPRALELYTRGLKELKPLKALRREGSRELVMEATLQLAFEAKKQGKRAEVTRRVREILADERDRNESVCAPQPSRYADSTLSAPCRGQSSAADVARSLLEETQGRGQK